MHYVLPAIFLFQQRSPTTSTPARRQRWRIAQSPIKLAHCALHSYSTVTLVWWSWKVTSLQRSAQINCCQNIFKLQRSCNFQILIAESLTLQCLEFWHFNCRSRPKAIPSPPLKTPNPPIVYFPYINFYVRETRPERIILVRNSDLIFQPWR